MYYSLQGRKSWCVFIYFICISTIACVSVHRVTFFTWRMPAFVNNCGNFGHGFNVFFVMFFLDYI